ncbi:FecR family protein, partial [Bordetella pertussis]
MADASTGVGERRQIVPGPGVRLVLASDSAVRLRIDATRRAIALLRGEMLVDVHSGAAQPALQVDTGYGMALAEQARFGVCRAGGSARIGVYAGSVQVASAPHAPWHRGEAGES